jgi:hypothetical protein
MKMIAFFLSLSEVITSRRAPRIHPRKSGTPIKADPERSNNSSRGDASPVLLDFPLVVSSNSPEAFSG